MLDESFLFASSGTVLRRRAAYFLVTRLHFRRNITKMEKSLYFCSKWRSSEEKMSSEGKACKWCGAKGEDFLLVSEEHQTFPLGGSLLTHKNNNKSIIKNCKTFSLKKVERENVIWSIEKICIMLLDRYYVAANVPFAIPYFPLVTWHLPSLYNPFLLFDRSFI